MTWHRHHCWSLTCDICNDGWDGLDGEPHFATRDDLEQYAKKAGWALTPLRAVCPECTPGELCALAGHSWGAWFTAGPFPTSTGGAWSGRVRYCKVCSAGDWDPPLGRPAGGGSST
jgi:hypothetical protein